MPDPKPLMREKDKMRGEVPSSRDGKLDGVYATYLEHIGVGTNPSVQLALATSSDRRFRDFLSLISSGTKCKIQTVAKQCGIDLLEFQNWFQKAANQIAIAEAQLKAAGIVTHMAEDALTKDEFCERCDGLGWVAAPDGLPVETPGYRILGMKTVRVKDGDQWIYREEPIWCRTCPKCKGKTSIRVIGDEHARDRVLEIAGITQRGGKSGVQIVQNFGGASHTSAVQGALSSLTIDVDAEEVTE